MFFWFRPPTLLATLLRPLAWLYNKVGLWQRGGGKPQILPIPVICVGNCVVGGAGKTPLVAAIAATLSQMGETPHILSRGYGGRHKGPVRVDPHHHTAAEVGDEPLMLSGAAPVWVAKNKLAGANAAIAHGATVLVLDDGMQNPSLHKTLTLLVVDAGRGFGNGLILPAGPLRESPAAAFARADALAVVGNDANPVLQNYIQQYWPGEKPLLTIATRSVCAGHALAGTRVLAFSGIANPQKFYQGIGKLGAILVKTVDFPDHYLWSHPQILALLRQAESLDATAITTAKDAARIPKDLQAQLWIADVALVWQHEAALVNLLKKALHRERLPC